jgi:phospholipase C
MRETGTIGKAGASLLSLLLATSPAFTQNRDVDKKADHQKTETPIKHVIVIIGENRTFDHLFATYVPKGKDSVSNLLSKDIIKADGTPGKNFNRAAQFEAVKPFRTDYFLSLSANEKKP